MNIRSATSATVCLLTIAGCVDGPQPAAPPLEIALGAVEVQAGGDQVYCQYVPPDGNERWISRVDVELGPASHHLLVFRVDASKQKKAFGPTPCGQLDLPEGTDAMLPGAQEERAQIRLPDGVAMHLLPTHGLFFQVHYLNASLQPITPSVKWRAETIAPGAVKTQAAVMFYSQWELKVPPGASIARAACRSPEERKLLLATGHMHRRGLRFDAALDGAPIFSTDSWSEPGGANYLLPGLTVPKGAMVEWSCQYQNDSSDTLEFGPSALANEMCIFAALYHPSRDGQTDYGCPP